MGLTLCSMGLTLCSDKEDDQRKFTYSENDDTIANLKQNQQNYKHLINPSPGKSTAPKVVAPPTKDYNNISQPKGLKRDRSIRETVAAIDARSGANPPVRAGGAEKAEDYLKYSDQLEAQLNNDDSDFR